MQMKRTTIFADEHRGRSAEEARHQILVDLEVDEGAYDDDLEPIESGAGACTVTVESTTHDTQSEIPRALAS